MTDTITDTITFNPPIFNKLIRPEGVFPTDIKEYIGAHALWYYYISALEIFKFKIDALQYEDEPNKEDMYNLSQLHSSIALMYGLPPEKMNNYWDLIEEQAGLLGSTYLPYIFIFNMVPEIRTQ